VADDWDVLDEPIGTATTWTRVNVGEAFPGVPTPLTWTWAGPASDAGVTRGWVRMGVFPRSESRPSPDVAEHFVAISHGRALLNLDRLRAIGDRIPCNSGAKVEQTLFMSDEVSGAGRPVRRRYPFVAAKLPVAVVRARRSLLASAPATEAWWRESVPRVAGDGTAACLLLLDSAQRYSDLAMNQAQTTVAGQGLFEALTALCRRFDLPAAAAGTLATTSEHAPEVATVEDLWRLAHGALDLATFLGRHGYHAPVQGELAVPSWREDPAPVESLAVTYRRRDDDDDPAAVQRRRRQDRDALEQLLLDRAPRAAAPAVRWLLAGVRAYVPLREVARLQFLQCYDVARAAATRLGTDLAATGAVEVPDDVFFLALDELTSGATPPAGVVGKRRERRAAYEAIEIPVRFTGAPAPRPVVAPEPSHRLVGIGGSAGVAEGRARVVIGPDDPNGVEDGEVLVAETTNPSYASFFLVASAVVVDIGGMLSHAAIVAREMGIPCVINTGNARHTIRTGDLLRVDGDRGVVEVLERATL
jgi:phosphohistidine swiveling domain-containing protein